MAPAPTQAPSMGGMAMGNAPSKAPAAGMGGMGAMAAPSATPSTIIVPQDVGMEAMSEPLNPDEFGYTVVRFVANNPGVWAFHCHLDAQAASGMVFNLRVADKAPGKPAWAVPRGLDSCSAM